MAVSITKSVHNLESSSNLNFIPMSNIEYDNSSINIIGPIDDIYICAEDVLRVLEYVSPEDYNVYLFKHVPEIFKKTLKEILEMYPSLDLIKQDPNMVSQHNFQNIYLTEAGLSYVIMSSNKPKTKMFQNHIYGLLKAIRTNRIKRMQQELEKINEHNLWLEKRLQQNNIEAEERYNKLMAKLEIISTNAIETNTQLINAKKQLSSVNKKLAISGERQCDMVEQLDETIDKLDCLKIDNENLQQDNWDLKETVNDMREDLYSVIEERNIAPKQASKVHYYLLLKRIGSTPIEFKLISGQASHINKQSKDLKGYEITIKEKNPNPIDLRVKIKEHIEPINQQAYSKAFQQLKETEAYKVSREKRILREKLRKANTWISVDLNKYILHNYKESDFIKLIGEIVKEKYTMTKFENF
ncbi:putative Bro-N domain-containing protein 15 [Diachasmimorpha longicaudata entomopoxvirus]|uniref:Putative Bro-N domain-containing protein 15 n=1 Tax=Diachasmimorpha longicaudata entomopoxvirus TaxID=109981 RepID=A0A7R5WM61_9POXV|nr:putative Bro-N domain-containing protein 15 [Diachasmimorpha longicaudata entomopoxvirus]AKS26409.1 putative Bro-N domain-containing protein 15 [Diachasmimorpha longicaudata entomopoxvirus]